MNETKPKDAVFESRAGLRLFCFSKMQLLILEIAFFSCFGVAIPLGSVYNNNNANRRDLVSIFFLKKGEICHVFQK